MVTHLLYVVKWDCGLSSPYVNYKWLKEYIILAGSATHKGLEAEAGTPLASDISCRKRQYRETVFVFENYNSVPNL